jgi:(p)ppGpp synthase/HD superfamily hydrolase
MSLVNLQTLTKAYKFACEKHDKQIRKNTKQLPYIHHPIEVVDILVRSGVTDIATLCAGVLHDTIEDTKTTYEELVQEFGKEIADIVMECTDDKSLPKLDRKKLQIEHSEHMSVGAKLVKMADKFSNTSSLINDPPKKWSPEEIQGYVVWSRMVCHGLKGVNSNLEKDLEGIFKYFGIADDDVESETFQSKLNDYYKIVASQIQ